MKYEAHIVGGANPDETAAIMAAVDQLMRDLARSPVSSPPSTGAGSTPWRRLSLAGPGRYGAADWIGPPAGDS